MPGGFSYLGNFKVQDSDGEVLSQSVGSSALLAACADAVTIEVDSTTGKLQIPDSGTSASNGVQRDQMSKGAGFWLQGTIAVDSEAAAAFQVQNTYGSNLIIDRSIIFIDTGSGVGGVTIDVGQGSGVGTSYDNLIDGLSLETAGAFDNLGDGAGSNGKTVGVWKSNEYINATASVTPTSLVGYYAIHVVDASS